MTALEIIGLTLIVVVMLAIDYANWREDRKVKPDPLDINYSNSWERGYELLTGRKR